MRLPPLLYTTLPAPYRRPALASASTSILAISLSCLLCILALLVPAVRPSPLLVRQPTSPAPNQLVIVSPAVADHGALDNELSESDSATPPFATSETAHGIFNQLRHSLHILQSEFFEVWLGTWPTAIDWTGAVVGTYISATLDSFSHQHRLLVSQVLPTLTQEDPEGLTNDKNAHIMGANWLLDDINRYFGQTAAYYFGQDSFAIRTQAHDDMLWVVLGWLESIKFINSHNANSRFLANAPALPSDTIANPAGYSSSGGFAGWHGKQFEDAFAHRARIFYELVAKAWNSSSLCGGGLTWNPNLDIYKNTITNTLFITSAVGMYLYHPGDYNRAPFISLRDKEELAKRASASDFDLPIVAPHDPAYLHLAREAYDWLRAVNLTNSQGLYVDGYHVSRSAQRPNRTAAPSQCDIRTEDVFTYNQGVLLSGLRGLWEGTGNVSYLVDGHALVRSVIRATGFHAEFLQTHPSTAEHPPGFPSDLALHEVLGKMDEWAWSGLGRHGILEDRCDSGGTCSQDGQTFKGIFFHHLALFCTPLPICTALIPGKSFLADRDTAILHRNSCREYKAWVEHNARAALGTRDRETGLVGMWWTPGLLSSPSSSAIFDPYPPTSSTSRPSSPSSAAEAAPERKKVSDVNDRGRGRTLETHAGGVAVLRAWLEFSRL